MISMKLFHYVDSCNRDVYINVEDITSIVGRDVYLNGNQFTVFKHTLTADQLKELLAMINSLGES